MSPDTRVRRFSAALLRFMARFAPPDTSEWAQAMQAELPHIDGDWPTFFWAISASGVLAKRSLLAFVFRARRQVARFPIELFSAEAPMKKSWITSAICAAAVLLLFAAPEFRQAFRVSVSAWRPVFRVGDCSQPELDALAEEARARNDAEGLAFAAVRIWDAKKSATWANEAVRLDNNLIWIYSVVAVRHADLADIEQWLPKLQRWDPRNALFYLIKAECIDIDHVLRGSTSTLRHDHAWQEELNAAFHSPKFDDYLDRLGALDRRVVLRYGFSDPAQILFGGREMGVPTYAFADTDAFADSVLETARNLGVGGDPRGALDKYWLVARFGQLISTSAHTEYEQWIGANLQTQAYKELQAKFQKQGDSEQAALMSYLVEQNTRDQEKWQSEFRARFLGNDLIKWNASVAKTTATMMIIFGGIITILALGSLVRWLQNTTTAPRVRRWSAKIGLASAFGLLLSAGTLYTVYRPYWKMYERMISAGDQTQIPELAMFLSRTHTVIFTFNGELNFVTYFWATAVSVCVAAMALVLLPKIFRLLRSTLTARS